MYAGGNQKDFYESAINRVNCEGETQKSFQYSLQSCFTGSGRIHLIKRIQYKLAKTRLFSIVFVNCNTYEVETMTNITNRAKNLTAKGKSTETMQMHFLQGHINFRTKNWEISPLFFSIRFIIYLCFLLAYQCNSPAVLFVTVLSPIILKFLLGNCKLISGNLWCSMLILNCFSEADVSLITVKR